LDDNGDGWLNFSANQPATEIRQIVKYPFKVVDNAAYDGAMSSLNAVRNGGDWATFTYAPNFLFAFQNNQGLDGAINSPSTVTAGEYKFTHNVGAIFNSDGVGSINKAMFTPSTGLLVNDIANSKTISQWVDGALQSNAASVRAWFNAHASVNSQPFTFAAPTPEIQFKAGSSLTDTDLFYAIGDAVVSSVTITVVVQRQQLAAGIEVLTSSSFGLGGVLTDLYDFDADAGSLSSYGAILQASYNSIARSGGHIFKIETNFAGSATVAKGYTYASYPIG
jgi:hypothetical protein